MDMGMMMKYFNTKTDFMNFMFNHLHVSGTGLIAVCFIFFILTMVLEASKSLSFYLQAKLKQHPLTYGQTVSSIQSDRSPLFTAIMIPSNIGQIKRKRIRFHFEGFAVHVFNLLLGYFIMLAVMTYSVYILIAVVIGSGLGHFIFGAITALTHAKFEYLRKRLYEEDSETDVTGDPGDVIMSDGSQHI